MRRRTIVIGLAAVVVLAVLAIALISRVLEPKQAAAPAYWPTQGWRTSTPEEQGLDSAKLAEGLKAMQEQDIRIDSLLIIRNGSVVLDATFYPYDGELLHNMASVTKSVMTTLIGIAAEQGKLQLDQPVVSFFPDRTIANLDARKEKITVRHLTGMVNGFESGCLAGDQPTIEKMQAAPDWVQAALDRKMVFEPGSEFCYDSPGMHLLSAILQKATGMTALDFATQEPVRAAGDRRGDLGSRPAGDHARLGRPALEAGRGGQARLSVAQSRRLGWQTDRTGQVGGRGGETAQQGRRGCLRVRLVGLGRRLFCLGAGRPTRQGGAGFERHRGDDRQRLRV